MQDASPFEATNNKSNGLFRPLFECPQEAFLKKQDDTDGSWRMKSC